MSDILQTTATALIPFCKNRLAVGVSGGRDSICLLHAVMSCGVVDKSNIIAVHVNHGLRKEADSDEKFVRDFCAANGIEFCAFRIDVKKECADNGLTVEHAARNLRYAVFYDLIKSGVADYILTAHHALDNAESILMHLFRGAGLDGMRGMSEAPLRYDLPLLRPFISVYPNELEEYRSANGLEYVTDSTNFIDDADRNFIRLNVIPLIEKRYSGVVRAVNEFASECRGACEFLDGALDPSLINYDRGAVTVADEALRRPALAARYIRRALGYFTTVDITRDMIARIAMLEHMRTGATVELTHGIKAAREYGRIALYLDRPQYCGETEVTLGANYIDGLVVDIVYGDAEPHSVRGGVADGDKLNGATLRFRRDGDMFTPCGGKRKKLKQFFIDNKIPKRLRDRIPLICIGNEVLVVVGVQISDGVKITAQTTQKAVVRLRGEI